jgi:hypothetical protein
MHDGGARTPRIRSLAKDLLRRVDGSGSFDREALASELVITEAALARYLDDATPIPLDRQLCIAQFIIEKVPAMAREGFKLRGQVAAAFDFATGTTETHSAPPGG